MGVHEQIVEQTVAIPVSQINGRVVDSFVLPIKDEIGRVGDQMVDVQAPPVMEDIVAVVQEEELVPQERVPQRTVKQAPVPRTLERDSRGGIGPDGTRATTD